MLEGPHRQITTTISRYYSAACKHGARPTPAGKVFTLSCKMFNHLTSILAIFPLCLSDYLIGKVRDDFRKTFFNTLLMLGRNKTEMCRPARPDLLARGDILYKIFLFYQSSAHNHICIFSNKDFKWQYRPVQVSGHCCHCMLAKTNQLTEILKYYTVLYCSDMYGTV